MLKLIPQAQRHEVHGASFDALASPRTGSTDNSVWIVSLAPGTQGMPHSLSREEIFVALDGAAQVRCEGETLDFPAGSALIVPAGVRFSLANPGDQAFRAVAVLPVGASAVLGDGSRFHPPWAQ